MWLEKIRVGDVFSAFYMLFLVPFLLLLLWTDVRVINLAIITLGAGVAGQSVSSVLWFTIFIVSFSFTIPGLRRMYYRFPALEPLIIMLLVDSTLVIVAYEIVNRAYEDSSSGGSPAFLLLAVVWLVGGRFLQCLFFRRYPIRFAGKEVLP